MKLLLAYAFCLPVSCFASGMPNPPNSPAPVIASQPLETVFGAPRAEALFATNSATLQTAAKSALDPLINNFRYQSTYRFKLSGHSDLRGSKNDNEVLSLRRANVVKAYLIERGVHPQRIVIEAYGESRAAANIRNKNEMIHDRRVVVRTEQINADKQRPQDIGSLAIKE